MTSRDARRKAAPLSLRLYVAGDSPNSMAAKARLREVLETIGGDRVSLEIVDLLRTPARGLADRILVTPTLVRVAPGPERRVIGNLRDTTLLLAALTEDDIHE